MTGTIDHTSEEQIVMHEREALNRWGRGDPGGFLELYADDVSYFDPATATRIDGQGAMREYYAPWAGRIHIEWYEMLNPQVVIDGNMALLTYNLVNYVRDATGEETVGSRWNSTVVYRRRENSWKAIHSHWSFTDHPAFRNQSPEESESMA